jgi:pantoate--beta-alanine ligase
MQIVKTIGELCLARSGVHLADGESFGFVPTMGALHEGHRSLMRRARQECSFVAASIFVNPLQFAPTEDLGQYPRTFEADCQMLEAEGVDLLFAPTAQEMYRPGATTAIHVQGAEDRLDGVSRPGHFTGVATVVAKLFHLVAPTRAYFGQKDAAQLAVLRQMVRDLDFQIELVGCPIVRDADGLALSSRNRYLSVEERELALRLPHMLEYLAGLILGGQRTASVLREEGWAMLTQNPGIVPDYLEIVDPDTLLPRDIAIPGSLIALAAKVGTTRLIDNFLVL